MNSLVLLVFVVFANAQLDVLQTIYGPVKGVVANGIRYFKGVPFAAAPIGKLRFRPPQPPAKWTTLRDATTEGNICPQGRSLGPLFIGDEDCLYLDVYIPANAAGPLPVMIWIYGGAYIIGDKYDTTFAIGCFRLNFFSGTNLDSMRQQTW
jgi:para-nitrobenzyl esterase